MWGAHVESQLPARLRHRDHKFEAKLGNLARSHHKVKVQTTRVLGL